MKPDVAKLRQTILQLAVNGKLTNEDVRHWHKDKLEKFLVLNYGKGISRYDRYVEGKYPVYGANGELGRTDKILVDEPAVIIGRKGTAGAVNLVEPNFWPSDVTYYVTAGSNFIIKYVYYLLKSLNLEQYSHGVKPGVSRKHVYDIDLVVPDIDTQIRIVKKVDELMALCDEVETKSDSFLNTISKLRLSILQLAIEGGLSTQDPDYESVETLIEKIEESKNRLATNGIIRKTKLLDAVSETEIAHKIPSSWAWIRLGSLGELNPRNPIIDESQEVSFAPMEVIPEKFNANTEYRQRKWGEVKKGYTHIADGDVLLAKVTPCFENGKSSVAENLVSGFGAGTTELHVFRGPNDLVLPKYIYYVFNSSDFMNKGKQSMTGAAGLQRVSKDFVNNYPIPLPPVEEQKKIVTKVDELMTVLDELETRLNLSERCMT